MKVLFIGHYKEGGGWSNASVDFILAMDRCGIDVVCRDIKLTNKVVNVPKRVLELEGGDPTDCTICIQHVLPHHIVGSDKFEKNIAYVETETLSIEPLSWVEHLKLVDEVWVPNRWMKDDLHLLGIDTKVVNHTHDVSKYEKDYPPLNIPQCDGRFKFYFIGGFDDRKNIESIIRCFHSEFDKTEQVSLILKVNRFGMNPEQLRIYVDQMITRVKQSLRMYPDMQDYIKDIVISEHATEDNIYALHQYADCFIAPSHGEAWSIPAFEAMAFGSTPICSRFGGPTEFIDNGTKEANGKGALVDGVFSICTSKDAAFPEMFTGREMWFQPCEMQIKKAMRFFYENRKPDLYKKQGLERAKEFSYEKIGSLIKEMLSE